MFRSRITLVCRPGILSGKLQFGLTLALLALATSCSWEMPEGAPEKARLETKPPPVAISVVPAGERKFGSYAELVSEVGDGNVPRYSNEAKGVTRILDDKGRPTDTVYSEQPMKKQVTFQKAGSFIGVQTLTTPDGKDASEIDHEFNVVDRRGKVIWSLTDKALQPHGKLYLSPGGDYIIQIPPFLYGDKTWGLPRFQDALKVRNEGRKGSDAQAWSLQAPAFSEDGKYAAIIRTPVEEKPSGDFLARGSGQAALAMKEYGKPRSEPEPVLAFYDSSGRELWTKPGVGDRCWVSSSGNYVLTDERTLLGREGGVLWRGQSGGRYDSVVFSKDERLILASGPGQLALIDVSSGKARWAQALEALKKNFFAGIDPGKAIRLRVSEARVAPDNSYVAAVIRAEYYGSATRYFVSTVSESDLFIFGRDGSVVWGGDVSSGAQEPELLISGDSGTVNLLGGKSIRQYRVTR
ncbi:MAG: hypothetical protein Q7R35_06850 [Elusimicrobiota bacterium]|nr:hypothetical protein [Elusimicrobiota bacterium]